MPPIISTLQSDRSCGQASAKKGRGEPVPLGLTRTCDGFNLAVFSRRATAMSLLLFDTVSGEPFEALTLDADGHRTGDVWHVALGDQVLGKPTWLRPEWFYRSRHLEHTGAGWR